MVPWCAVQQRAVCVLLPLLDTLVSRPVRVPARPRFAPGAEPSDSFSLHCCVMMNGVAVTAVLHVFSWPSLFFALDDNGGWRREGHGLFTTENPPRGSAEPARSRPRQPVRVPVALHRVMPSVCSVESSRQVRYRGLSSYFSGGRGCGGPFLVTSGLSYISYVHF